MMDIIEKIKEHFEEEAREFDETIRKLIPYYQDMVAAVVETIPFEKSASLEVIDLGCGTGTVARAVKDAFPKARITCLDLSGNMLRLAADKLGDTNDTTYINCSFYDFDFNKKYDVAVSSLALHHMVSTGDKLDFYKKIYTGLKTGGVFINADVVTASTDCLQKVYMRRWKDFMCENMPKDEVENKWIPKHFEEDRPVSMMEHLDMLNKAGFKIMDVVWKYYNYAVYMAVR